MKRSSSWLTLATLIMTAGVMMLPGCGHDQVLTGITVTPSGATITGAGVIVSFTATGTYIHPPEQKDLTGEVVWASAAPQVIDFGFTGSTAGQAMSGSVCGQNIAITATHYSNLVSKTGTVVIGTATVNVTHTGC